MLKALNTPRLREIIGWVMSLRTRFANAAAQPNLQFPLTKVTNPNFEQVFLHLEMQYFQSANLIQ